MLTPTPLQPLVNAAHGAYVWIKNTFVEVFTSFCSLFTAPPSTCTDMVVYTGPPSTSRTKPKATNSRALHVVILHNICVYLRCVRAQLKRLPAQRAYERAVAGARKSQAAMAPKAAKAKATKVSFTRPLARTFFAAAAFVRLTTSEGFGAISSLYSPGLSGPQSATAVQPTLSRAAPKSPLARLVTSISTPMRSFYASAVNSIGSLGRWSVLLLASAFGSQTAETSGSIPRSPVPELAKNNVKNASVGSPGSLGPLNTALPHSMAVQTDATTKKKSAASAVPLARVPRSLVLTMGSPVA